MKISTRVAHQAVGAAVFSVILTASARADIIEVEPFGGDASETFELVAPGFHVFETEEEVRPGEATEVVYFLREKAIGIPETIVRVQKEKKEVSRRSIAIETIARGFGVPKQCAEQRRSTSHDLLTASKHPRWDATQRVQRRFRV